MSFTREFDIRMDRSHVGHLRLFTCEYCGRLDTALRKNKRFCKDTCRAAMHYKKRKEGVK